MRSVLCSMCELLPVNDLVQHLAEALRNQAGELLHVLLHE
jgi:hypothetical protein